MVNRVTLSPQARSDCPQFTYVLLIWMDYKLEWKSQPQEVTYMWRVEAARYSQEMTCGLVCRSDFFAGTLSIKGKLSIGKPKRLHPHAIRMLICGPGPALWGEPEKRLGLSIKKFTYKFFAVNPRYIFHLARFCAFYQHIMRLTFT